MDVFGFCNIAIIPVRAAANHRSEMVTQLLFGEAYRVIDTNCTAGWIEIKTQFDDYSGYIDANQVVLMHSNSWKKYYLEQQYKVASSQTSIFDKKRNIFFPIPAGSSLPMYDGETIRLGAEIFEIQQEMEDYSISLQENLKTIALSYLNIPYLWGGRTHWGIDCSGFNQMVFKILGIPLPRNASQQILKGQCVNSLAEVQVGDVAFFENKENVITHTGILLSTNTIIHASGNVRIDIVDQRGIYCVEREEYSHKLKAIKRNLICKI